MTTHSSFLAWKIPWTEATVRRALQSCKELQRLKLLSMYWSYMYQWVTHRVTIWRTYSTLRCVRRNENTCPHKSVHVDVYSSIIHSSQKKENNQWYIHTMEYYSANKRNELLMHARTWLNLENIMLSVKSQSQKDHILYDYIYSWFPELSNLCIERVY